MKIGYEAKRIFHNRSGLGNYGRNLLTGLARYYPENQYWLYNPYPANIPFAVGPMVREQRPKYALKIYGQWWRQYALAKRAAADRVDLFHGLSQELPHHLDRYQIPSVVTVHDLIFERFPQLYRPIDRKIYRQKLGRACQMASRIVAVSQQTSNDLTDVLDIAPQQILVVPQSCDPVFWQDLRQEIPLLRKRHNLPERFLLFVGTLEPRKQPVELAKRCLAERIPLVLVGKAGSYWRDFWEKLSLKEQQWIRPLRVESVRDLAALYQASAGFVYPSLFEGFGIPLLEAQASKVPLITFDNSALKEVAGPGTWLVKNEDWPGLSQALRALWGNLEEAQQRAIENHRFARQSFTAESLSAQWNEIYQSLL